MHIFTDAISIFNSFIFKLSMLKTNKKRCCSNDQVTYIINRTFLVFVCVHTILQRHSHWTYLHECNRYIFCYYHLLWFVHIDSCVCKSETAFTWRPIRPLLQGSRAVNIRHFTRFISSKDGLSPWGVRVLDFFVCSIFLKLKKPKIPFRASGPHKFKKRYCCERTYIWWHARNPWHFHFVLVSHKRKFHNTDGVGKPFLSVRNRNLYFCHLQPISLNTLTHTDAHLFTLYWKRERKRGRRLIELYLLTNFPASNDI